MPTEQLIVVLAVFAGGLALGAVVTALLASRRRADALEQAALRFEVTRAQLTDRAGTAERELGEARAQLAAEGVKLDEQRAAVTELHGRAESLATALRMEREAAAGKLAEIERARENLTQAFSALSAEALKSNNQAFIDLAQQSLAKHQEAAKGELEKRQQAIDELVKPMRETLEKFDAKVQEIEKSRTARTPSSASRSARSPRLRRSCGARRRTSSRRCASRTSAGAGARCSCGAWSRWRACSITATSTSRRASTPTTAGCART